MASPTYEKDDAQVSIATSNSGDKEAGLDKPKHHFYVLPRWPRVVAAAIHLIIMLSSVTIIALVAHSLRSYSTTKNIKFSGLNASWPKDLNLKPVYLFLIISVLSLIMSMTSSIYLIIRRNCPAFTFVEVVSLLVGVVILVIWIIGDVLQYRSERTPKTNVLKWSCRRKSSPTNTLVKYASTCNEQETIKGLAVLVTVLEFIVFASQLVTFSITRSISKKLNEVFS